MVHTGLDLPPIVLILLDWIILQLPKHHGRSLVKGCFTPCGASSVVSPLDLSRFRSAAGADLWSAHWLSSLWSQLQLFFPSFLQFKLTLLTRASPTIIWPTAVVSENSIFAVIYHNKDFAFNRTHSFMAGLCLHHNLSALHSAICSQSKPHVFLLLCVGSFPAWGLLLLT